MEGLALRPAVKICGLMRAEDVRMCVRHGVDIIGFVVDYPRPVPWNIGAESVKELMKAVSRPTETCIVTGGDAERIIKLALETRPDYIQLHYGESPADTAFIADNLSKHNIKVIKSLFPDSADLENTARKFEAAGVYALLLDPRTPDNAVDGGAADFAAYIKIKSAVKCPVVLAGGINPGTAEEAVRQTGASIIDLMTGVERSPGIKDEEKIKMLVISLFAGQSRPKSLKNCSKTIS